MGTHYSGSPEEVRALNAYIKLMRAADTVSAYVCKHLQDVHLTISQFGTLEALYFLGPMCQKTLAQKILKSTGNMTLVVDNLEKRGLVKRQQDPNDRRFVTVSLTPAGRDLIETIFPEHLRRILTAFRALTPEEQAHLENLLKKLGLHCVQLASQPPS